MQNEDVNEKIARSRNMLYYDQLLKNYQKEQHQDARHPHSKTKNPKKRVSFAAKKVELRDFAPVPEGWEYFVYTFYAIAIPYILGAIFLFFAVAGADYGNFMLLNMSAFIVVWLIGYEILAAIMLLWILKLYLQYEDTEKYY